MKIAYFDCFSGISGNMVLGALLDAGLELDALKKALAELKITGYKIETRKVQKMGISGTLVNIKTKKDNVERHLGDILDIIHGSTLSDDIKDRATTIFTRLAEAEAKVHGTNIEEIHFHEVGGLDAIVDIVGSVLSLTLMGIEDVYSSPIHLGRGFVKCAHGLLPVPSPATTELVKGVPTYGRDIESELTTPTGAAIITTLAKEFARAPMMEVEAIGYGAGNKDLSIPNLLRVSIGEVVESTGQGYEEDMVTLIEANIDDMNPELYEYVMSRLMSNGALDVFLTPIQMKKNRPAVKLSTIVREADLRGVLDVFFEETTTLGVRFSEIRRKKLSRSSIDVETQYGMIGVKVGKLGDVVKNISPEYEDCQRIALQLGIPLKDVYDAAKRACMPE